ncbi:armadillo/beta-catenin/plakoglobin [Amylocystis lapponica]|nr:armadillo/beta-catenin/plakoglobin [Amylocystis lapponica]
MSSANDDKTSPDFTEASSGRSNPPPSRTATSPGRDTLQAKKNTVLKSHGRPPWYGEDGEPICDAFVIGIAANGNVDQTHVARRIVQSLGSIPAVIILSQDSFYKRHTPEETELAFASRFDFDHPGPVHSPCLADLKAGRQSNIPIYSFTEHQRQNETKYLYGAAIIIAEGIMTLHDPALRALYDLKIFVQCDSDLMLARRLRRDVKERGRDVDGILEQYLRYVKPAYDNFVLPTSRHANIIVPGSDNGVAIELISTHVRRQLEERATRMRGQLAVADSTPVPGKEYLNLTVLPRTPQLEVRPHLHRASDHRGDFIFFVDRLSTLLAEKATEHLPYRPKSVITPVEVESIGKVLDTEYLCGVSILRSGGPLECGLRRVFNNLPIGSMLIQSDATSGEPLLLHLQLPVYIRDRALARETWVFLLDAQIGTGAAAFMAIRVLLDHGVLQKRIIFVTFLVARSGGVCVLQNAFPDVQIVCGAVDDGLREMWLEIIEEGDGQLAAEGRKVWVVEPGMGQIGDRYYL